MKSGNTGASVLYTAAGLRVPHATNNTNGKGIVRRLDRVPIFESFFPTDQYEPRTIAAEFSEET